MQHGLTPERYGEIDRKLEDIEAVLVALAQETRDATAPVDRHSHTWLQADNVIGYARSWRAALQREDLARR